LAIGMAMVKQHGRAMTEHQHSLHPIRLGLSLGTFLIIAYVACLALSLVVPDRGLHQVWLQLYPGFSWTLRGVLLGLVESFVYGFFGGLIFALIYNAFNIVDDRHQVT
jgi:hypothetical protein